MPGGAGISGYTIKTVTVDQAGNVYLLMLKPVTTGGGADPTVTTPLFRADAGSWTVIYSVNLPVPLTGFNYGHTVADPLHVGTLYATYGGSVFPVVVNGNVATWTSVAAGLPGGDIDDLWASSVSNVRTDRSPITAWRS
jgi:hypothetical protein